MILPVVAYGDPVLKKEAEEAAEPAPVGHVYKSADEALAATSEKLAEKQFAL